MHDLRQLQAEMSQRGLERYFDATLPFLRNGISLLPDFAPSQIPDIGCSKFGGQPDLPTGTAWFRNPDTGLLLSFVCQIDLAQAAPFDTEGLLPHKGLLYFFCDCTRDHRSRVFEPGDRNGWKLYYFEGDPGQLCPAPFPEGTQTLPKVFPCAPISFASRPELPLMSAELARKLRLPKEEGFRDRCWRWTDEATKRNPNKLLGHADPIQDAMEGECEKALQASQGAAGTKNHSWRLLLQIDSMGKLRMNWADDGRLYLWITEEDLAQRHFHKAQLILQSY
ncbi:MAG: DUF1963 domain-containing protein [Oscillospiraceae bacterium]|nr:DUF1963 domain-containing protein [Oscillospiraceae bacterium]